MTVVFFGTSDYCLPVLQSLHQDFDLKLVVTRPDKPVGRKKITTSSATKLWAIKNDVAVTTPTTLKKNSPGRRLLKQKLESISPDLAVVSDYGLIIPEEIFTVPKFGTINIHFSNLPDLRGPSPVQFTLLRGETAAWVTIFKLQNPPELKIKMDSGPILFQENYSILPTDTTPGLYIRLFEKAAKVLTQVIRDYALSPDRYLLIPQDHRRATFSRFLDRNDGFISWPVLQKSLDGKPLEVSELPKVQVEALSATTDHIHPATADIYNFFRAVTPWPGVWTIKDGKRLKILKCHLKDNKLILDQIQFEGKKPQPFSDKLIS